MAYRQKLSLIIHSCPTSSLDEMQCNPGNLMHRSSRIPLRFIRATCDFILIAIFARLRSFTVIKWLKIAQKNE